MHVCTNIHTKVDYAMKAIDKSKIELKYLEQEVAALRSCNDHNHVLKLVDVYESETHIYLVTELARGGHLLERVGKVGSFSEKDACRIISQMTEAIAYLHRCGIVHRDLKPENLLLTSVTEFNVMICDFGLAKRFTGSELKKLKDGVVYMKTACGSRLYCAPEVLMKARYNYKVDLWGIGITLFILLSGHHPFEGGSPDDQVKKVVNCDYNFNAPQWKFVTDEAKDLISKLLVKDFSKRYTTAEILSHKWITEVGPRTHENLNIADTLMSYSSSTGITKVVLTMMYSEIPPEELEKMKTMFKEIDTEGKGYVDVEGVAKYLHRR